jgi:hypothetical protein
VLANPHDSMNFSAPKTSAQGLLGYNILLGMLDCVLQLGDVLAKPGHQGAQTMMFGS